MYILVGVLYSDDIGLVQYRAVLYYEDLPGDTGDILPSCVQIKFILNLGTVTTE